MGKSVLGDNFAAEGNPVVDIVAVDTLVVAVEDRSVVEDILVAAAGSLAEA